LVHGFIEPFEPIRTGDGAIVVVLATVGSLSIDGVEGRARAEVGEPERRCVDVEGPASRVGT